MQTFRASEEYQDLVTTFEEANAQKRNAKSAVIEEMYVMIGKGVLPREISRDDILQEVTGNELLTYPEPPQFKTAWEKEIAQILVGFINFTISADIFNRIHIFTFGEHGKGLSLQAVSNAEGNFPEMSFTWWVNERSGTLSANLKQLKCIKSLSSAAAKGVIAILKQKDKQQQQAMEEEGEEGEGGEQVEVIFQDEKPKQSSATVIKRQVTGAVNGIQKKIISKQQSKNPPGPFGTPAQKK